MMDILHQMILIPLVLEIQMLDDVLVEATGILQKNISRYETGAVFPALETLERIAKTLKKPFGYFPNE